jgi:hypothetical protein
MKQKCAGLLTKSDLLLHDKAWPQSANMSQQLLLHFQWEILEHLVYSPIWYQATTICFLL